MKRLLANAYDKPQFPSSQWNNVLAGQYVDLDVVLSASSMPEFKDKRVEHSRLLFKLSDPQEIGFLPGTPLPTQSDLFSHIEKVNLPGMGSSSRVCSEPSEDETHCLSST